MKKFCEAPTAICQQCIHFRYITPLKPKTYVSNQVVTYKDDHPRDGFKVNLQIVGVTQTQPFAFKGNN